MKILLKINLKKNVCEHEGQIFLTNFMLFFPEKHTQKATQQLAYYYLSDSVFTGQKF
jgi:hypothetical protein